MSVLAILLNIQYEPKSSAEEVRKDVSSISGRLKV